MSQPFVAVRASHMGSGHRRWAAIGLLAAALLALELRAGWDPQFLAPFGSVSQRQVLRAAATGASGDSFEEPIFSDLFGGEEDQQLGLAGIERRAPRTIDQGAHDVDLEMEMEDPEGNFLQERPVKSSPAQQERALAEKEAQYQYAPDDVEVSDEEVEEFLAELEERPAIKPVPDGAIGIDPFPTDATKSLDVFRELRSTPDRRLIYERGMPDQQMLLTLKDRMRMLAELAQDGNWQRARFMVRGIWRKRKLRLPLGRILWNLMIKAHVRADRPKAAESWVTDMLDRVYQPDIISYNTLLYGLSKAGDYLKVEKWLKRMRARGVEPDEGSYTALAHAYSKAEHMRGVERSLESMQASGCIVASARPYNALFKLCAQRGEDQLAERWLSTMQEAGILPDHVTFLMLIKASTQAGDTDAAARWLNEMQQAGLRPGRQHFHAVMTAHARVADLSAVDTWFQVMRDQGLHPDVFSYNIWMSAAAQAGKTEAAEGIMSMMQADRIEPDVVSYSTIIGAFAEARDIVGATQWLYRAEREGVEPDLTCYNQAIKACARAGNSTVAEHLARRLLRHSLTPDMYTYNTLLRTFAKDGNPSAAEFWIDHLQRQARWRYCDFPSKQIGICYSEVLQAHVRSGNLEAAEAWLQQMIGEGIEPDARCYAALARAHLQQGRTSEARKWCDRMASWSSLVPPQDLLQAVCDEAGNQAPPASLQQESALAS